MKRKIWKVLIPVLMIPAVLAGIIKIRFGRKYIRHIHGGERQ